jgi:hypothetical protein
VIPVWPRHSAFQQCTPRWGATRLHRLVQTITTDTCASCHRYYFQYEDWKQGFASWRAQKQQQFSRRALSVLGNRTLLLLVVQVGAAWKYFRLSINASLLLAAISTGLFWAATAVPWTRKRLDTLLEKPALRVVTKAARRLTPAPRPQASGAKGPAAAKWDDGITWQRARIMYEDLDCFRRFNMVWAKPGAGARGLMKGRACMRT